MKQIAFYMRVSTEGQEDEETIENQEIEIRKHIEELQQKYILLPEHIYKDDGWSGAVLKRPALDELRNTAKNKTFDVLYVYDRGRIARFYWMQEVVINELLELGIETISVADLNPKNDGEVVISGMQGLFHQYERAKIKERMRIGKYRKVHERKKLLGYSPKYGYTYLYRIKNGPDAREGQFIINESQAKVVRMIFNWFAEGKSRYWVRDELYRLGIPPAKAKRDIWCTSVLDRLVRDTTYMGVHYYNKTESVETKNPRIEKEYSRTLKGSRVSRPREEWMQVEVDAIISKELFEKVQEQLARNKRTGQRNNSKNQYLLGGIIDCVCGYARTGDPANNSTYYRCTDRLNNACGTRKCYETGINVPVLDLLVWNNLKELLTQPELVFAQAKKWQDGITPLHIQLNTLNQRLTELDEKEVRYAKMYGEGVMSEQIYRDSIVSLNETRERIVGEISATNDELASKPVIEVETLVEGVIKLVEDLDFSKKKEIVQKIVTKVVATKKEVTVWGYIPVLATEKVGLNVKHSYPEVSNQLSTDSKESEVGLDGKYRNRGVAKRRKVDAF